MQAIINKPTHAGSETSARAEKSAGFISLVAAQSGMKLQKNQNNAVLDAHPEACEKKVEVVSDKGVVKLIRVHCSCGEVTEIQCEYSE
jgi:hypothetical protein